MHYRKTTAAWGRSCGGYFACSGLRRPILHGSSWLAWDIVVPDGACVVGYFRLLLGWWYAVVVLYGVIVRVDVPIRPDIVCLLEMCCVTCVDVPIRPAKLFEWSCVRRGLMSKSNPLMLLSCVSFLFTDYSLSGLYFCIFSAILIEMHLSSVVRLKKNLLYPSNREIHPY